MTHLLLLFALPFQSSAAVTADIASSYNWGNYSTANQTDSTHSGIGMQLLVAFRSVSRFEVGLAATFAFPQITVADSVSDAAFSYRSMGLLAGYLWRDKIEPFVHYSPWAELTQTTKSRLGVTTVSTDLNYQGHAFGGGLKIYLSPRNEPVAQLGLRFTYSREIYGSVKVTSSRPIGPTQEQSVSGNTFSTGFFVGI